MKKKINMSSSGFFMKRAIELAKLAAKEHEVPVGAVIVKNGVVVAEGRNQKERSKNPIDHAEMIAIQLAAEKLDSWRLLDCELYVTLEPCPMCLAAAQQARIKRIVYGAEDKKGGAIHLGYDLYQNEKTNHRFEVNYELTEECQIVLKDFFKAKREKK
jgi:tRNA(adenine34) deaminase